MIKPSHIATFVRALDKFRAAPMPRHREATALFAAWVALKNECDALPFSSRYERQAAGLELVLASETDDLQRLYLRSAIDWAHQLFAAAVIRSVYDEPETESRIEVASVSGIKVTEAA
jgi:hypothetical protein